MAESGKKPIPQCKAILLCDLAIIDTLTKKISIIGIIDKFYRLPNGVISHFTAFAQLVQGVGAYQITVEIHDLSDIQEEKVIARSPALEIKFTDRMGRKNVIIQCPPLRLEQAGEYDVVLCADGEEIDRQTFVAEDMKVEP